MGGGDKALLTLGGMTLLDRVIARLEPQVGAIMLNANGDPARFDAWGLPVRADAAPDHPGPLAGVLAGMDWAAERGASAIVTVAADTPFFPRDLTARLMAAGGGGLALAASPDPRKGMMRHPTFGLWPVALRHDLRSALADGLRKIVLWTDKHHAATAEFAVGAVDPFYNLNTPEDLARAQDLAKGLDT
ncbi:MAG: molybdopterin-guanine dinucleotide biosynthesis protein A [Paracoccaceae bacterium]|jgi:molybdopterin-guanine dinucleotide biosynthesis protein A